MAGENQLGHELAWGRSSVRVSRPGDGALGEQVRRDQELACVGEGWQRLAWS